MVDTKTPSSPPGDKKLSVPSKTLTLKPRVETGTVRQSFSHGRSKQVVVEKRGKRRIGDHGPEPQAPEVAKVAKPSKPAPASGRSAGSPRNAGSGVVLRTLTEDERSARASALADAKLREVEERRQAEEEAKRRAEHEAADIPDEVHQYIADKIESNIRELEGSLTRVIAFASLEGRPITVGLAEEALQDTLSPHDPRQLSPRQVMSVVGNYYAVSVDDLISPRRDRKVSVPRQVCMFLLRDLGHSLPYIGLEFGGRDHSTVIHAINKITADAEVSTQRRNELSDLKKRLNQ